MLQEQFESLKGIDQNLKISFTDIFETIVHAEIALTRYRI